MLKLVDSESSQVASDVSGPHSINGKSAQSKSLESLDWRELCFQWRAFRGEQQPAIPGSPVGPLRSSGFASLRDHAS